MHRIIAVTPAGRRRYLEVLAHYVIADRTIDEWQIWENCRDPSDRAFLEHLAREHPDKVQIVRMPGADGGLRSINRFYPALNDPGAFYIKLDDDIVWLPRHLGARLYQHAVAERSRYIWWSPLIVNNALCTWLLKYHSQVHIDADITAQAGCVHAWRSPLFAMHLHRAFLSAVRTHALPAFEVPDFPVSLSRFSINCIGFFGSDVARLGAQFCPPDVDDEEWISAVLPTRTGRPGRIVGHLQVSHFSFYTQERFLLSAGVLDEYYRLAGLHPRTFEIPHLPLKHRVKRHLLTRWLDARETYEITLPSSRQTEAGAIQCLSPSQQ